MFCISCCFGNTRKKSQNFASKSFVPESVKAHNSKDLEIKELRNAICDMTETFKNKPSQEVRKNNPLNGEFLALYSEDAGVFKDTGKKIEIFY